MVGMAGMAERQKEWQNRSGYFIVEPPLPSLLRCHCLLCCAAVEWWNGGMAEWQNGGVAEWRSGGMGDGGMTEWRMAELRNGGKATYRIYLIYLRYTPQTTMTTTMKIGEGTHNHERKVHSIIRMAD